MGWPLLFKEVIMPYSQCSNCSCFASNWDAEVEETMEENCPEQECSQEGKPWQTESCPMFDMEEDLLNSIKQELDALFDIGVKIPVDAKKNQKIEEFFQDFSGGSRDLSGMIDAYLMMF
jgi:hypothetical protein